MKKLLFATVVLAILLATVACGAQSSATSIVGPTWQLQQMKTPDGTTTIQTPSSYTLYLGPSSGTNGKFNFKADCNSGNGAYVLNGKSLTLNVQTTTMAMCGAGSQGNQYIANLGKVQSYDLKGNNLTLNLAANGGTMLYNVP